VHLGRRRRLLASGSLARRGGTSRIAASAGSRRFDRRGGRDGVAGAVGRPSVEGGVTVSRIGVAAEAAEGGREGDGVDFDHRCQTELLLDGASKRKVVDLARLCGL